MLGPCKLGPGILGPWKILVRQIGLLEKFKDVKNYISKCLMHKCTNTQYTNTACNCWLYISNTNIYIGEYMSFELIYWYWIYSANNWGIYVNWRVKTVRLQNMLFLKKRSHILVNAQSATLRPKGAQTPHN